MKPPDERFLNTFAVCVPCHNHHNLWVKWHDEYGVPWEQDSLGMWQEIGKVDNRPVVVSVNWADIAGRRVAFVEPTSQLVDYVMVDKWAKEVFPNAIEFVDDNNFHNIIHPIAAAIGVKSIMARKPEMNLYAKYAPKDPDFMKNLVGANTRTPASRVGQLFKRITYRDLPKQNHGWNKKLSSMDWSEVCLDGYPGWQIEMADGQKAPAFVKLTHVRGKGTVESNDLATKWDDIASETFYQRDWTDDGIPFVHEHEVYWSGWWFKTIAERDRFVAWQAEQK